MRKAFNARKPKEKRKAHPYMITGILDKVTKVMWDRLPQKSLVLRAMIRQFFHQMGNPREQAKVHARVIQLLEEERQRELDEVNSVYDVLVTAEKRKIAKLNMEIEQDRAQVRLNELTNDINN